MDITIKYTKEELEQLAVEKTNLLLTLPGGHFEAESSTRPYEHDVICRWVKDVPNTLPEEDDIPL